MIDLNNIEHKSAIMFLWKLDILRDIAMEDGDTHFASRIHELGSRIEKDPESLSKIVSSAERDIIIRVLG